jgi:hypothetical protein
MKTDAFLFSMLEDSVKEHGMWEVTPEVMQKIWRASGDLEPPVVERTIDVKDRVSFVLHINGYIFSLHTTFNRSTNKFSPYTAISMVIAKLVNKGSERILTRFVYRTKNPVYRVKKVIQFVQYMVDELKDRWPLTKDGNWAELKETSHEKFYWVDGKKKIRNFFESSSSYPLVHKAETDRLYYHATSRKKKKVKNYRRYIRKKYKKRIK